MKLEITNNRAKTTEKAPIIPFRLFEGRTTIDKQGRLSFDASQHNLSTFLQHVPDAQIVETASIDFGEQPKDVLPRPKFKEVREGRFWQKEAIGKIQNLIANSKMPRAFAFFYCPGGGKSKSLTDMAMQLYCAGEIDAMVVLPPNLLVSEQWTGDDGALITDVQSDAQSKTLLWEKTKTKRFDAAYDDLKSFDGFQSLVLNIDAAKTARGQKTLKDFIKHHKGRVLFAIDESHLIKTPSSGRHKACLELGAKCAWRAILTGTPVSKSLVDAWAQFRFLDERILGYRYVSTFKSKFCIQRFNGFANEIVGHQNEDEFYRRIEPFSVRVSEAEMGLKKVHSTFEFKLEGEQKQHFDALKKKWMTKLDNGEFSSASIALTAAIRMHQVASGFLVTDGDEELGIKPTTHVFEDNARLKALDAYLEANEFDKVVIWCRFRINAEQLSKHFGKSAVEISGNIDSAQKTPNKERFINDPSVKYLIATPDAAGTGMDGLQSVCNRAVFFNTHENYVLRTQAENRTLRLGGSDTSFYTDLVAKDSGDKKILRVLQGRKDLSSASLDEVRGIFMD